MDTADDFVTMAKKFYPRLDPDLLSDLEWDQFPDEHHRQPPQQLRLESSIDESDREPEFEIDLEADDNNNESKQ